MSQADGVVDRPIQGEKNEDYTWVSATLGCYDRVQLRLRFKAKDIQTTKIQVLNTIYTYANFVPASGDTYCLYIETLTVCDFAKICEAVFLDEENNAVGQSVRYSVNTYVDYIASNANSEVKDLVQAIYNYGCSANRYASAING